MFITAEGERLGLSSALASGFVFVLGSGVGCQVGRGAHSLSIPLLNVAIGLPVEINRFLRVRVGEVLALRSRDDEVIKCLPRDEPHSPTPIDSEIPTEDPSIPATPSVHSAACGRVWLVQQSAWLVQQSVRLVQQAGRSSRQTLQRCDAIE